MKGNRFKLAYQLRFVPLIIAIVNLLIMLVLKYVVHIELSKVLYYSIFGVIAAFIYMQAMRERKKENDETKDRELNPPPPPTEAELKEIRLKEINSNIAQQQSNIGFRLVYLSLGIWLFLISFGFIFFQHEYVLGGVLLIGSIIFIIHSILVLRTWIRHLKMFKKMKKNI